MTPGAIQQQIEAWQPVLGLADWDVRYSTEPPEPDDRARIDSWAKRRIAVIRFDAGIPVEAVDRAIVHELLHLWLNQLGDLYPRAFTPPPIDEAYEAAWDLIEHQMIGALEGAITGRALVLWDEPAWTAPWRPGANQPLKAASVGTPSPFMSVRLRARQGDPGEYPAVYEVDPDGPLHATLALAEGRP